MKSQKLNFTIPEETAAKLLTVVGKRHRSAFVAAAIREKLKHMEEEQLQQTLIEGYHARREESSQVNEEWEAATLEGWA